ncbi:hypothetical protein DFQ27_003736 [Actinomortierella ambigua]|uniref:Protein kinase domain-containing protein n=1 Tax=Actinomortierella ambigua TaxID=1343610 RepID=A0A9P6Q5P5_9FUNG|nr:hypothetical protein DFQ27_003736 [Actinomortierella ambigua]
MNSENTTQTRLEIGEIVGAGVYGVVFQGRYNTRKAAIKKFRLHQHATDQAKIIEQEIGLLRRLQHRHVIQFYGVHREGNEISLIMDFAEGGSLKQAIEDSRVADWRVKSRIAQEIAYGLAYIHHEGILHQDLKSDNVLLTGLMEVKLCDFDFAVVKTSSGGYSTEVLRGTVRWMAPELVLSERPRYTNKSDMYALGMVMWEMAAMCTVPFKAMDNSYAVALAVHGGKREQLPDETPANYQHWVELCWKQDPFDRPAAHDVTIVQTDIVEDVPWLRQGAITPSSFWSSSTDSLLEHGMVSEVPFPASSEPEEPRATQPLMTFVSLSRKATLNDIDAQVSLAEMYETGSAGVPKDNEMAFVWYLRAAQLGNIGAMDRISDMYAEGRGTEQSDNEAARWHNQASEQRKSNLRGNVESILTMLRKKRLAAMKSSLGSRMHVVDTNQDGVRAGAEIQAAERGDAEAQFNLGLMYEHGRGVEQSDVEAIKWYTKAANQGNSKAQFNLGLMYRNSRGVGQSETEAIKWYTKAASHGNPEAQFKVGCMHETGRGVEQSYVEAVRWYTKAASQGNSNAQNNLGCLYDLGQGVKQDDMMAVEWYKKSSAQGNTHGHGNLASMYELGFGVEPSDDLALDLFNRAHEKGYPIAHFHVKWLTSTDRRTPRNDSDAFEVNRIGAEKGYVAAQHNLGRLYERGRGVRMDKVQALLWYRKAAAQGHFDSQQRMEFIQRQYRA